MVRKDCNAKNYMHIIFETHAKNYVHIIFETHTAIPSTFTSDRQHHEKKQQNKMSGFLKSKLPRVSRTHCLYMAIYFLYLLAASRGIPHTFEDTAVDPMMQPNQNKVLRAYFALKNKVDTDSARKNPNNLEISEEVQQKFTEGNTQVQREILNTLDFEFRNNNLTYLECASCMSQTMTPCAEVTGRKQKCSQCSQHAKYTRKYFLRHNMLPVWYDEEGNPQYHVPEELQNLTFGEKLLIQKNAVLIPVVHISNGRIGLKGHTVTFRKDVMHVCTTLPRMSVDMVHVLREITESDDENSFRRKSFKIRRSKVLNALKWLQKHHSGYKDIVIHEENLDWMNGDEESILNAKQVTILDMVDNLKENEESVAAFQTERGTESAEDSTMAFNGTSIEHSQDKYNEETIELVEQLTQSLEKTGQEIPTLMFPQVDEKPIDEYTTPNVFADAYPWLFPGGFGDSASEYGEKASEALAWTRILLRYRDGRFMRDPVFSFHLMNYVQRHLNNKEAVWFIKKYISGKEMTVEDLKEEIARNNLDFVHKIQSFAGQKIRGSDGWWRNRKHELDTWIAHHLQNKNGPPTMFMTFSCAEYWWSDLEKMLVKRCQGTEDEKVVHDMMHHEDDKKKLSAKTKILESYAAIVQEFFQIRLDNWMETVGKNVFNISHYYNRFEFAKGRGQIHAHMLCVTKDNHFIAEFYKEYVQNKRAIDGTEVYAKYARSNLAMTGEKPEMQMNEPIPDAPLSGRFCETVSVKNDLAKLVEQTHMHDCNDYCLRFQKK